jgi:hypothetical protein
MNCPKCDKPLPLYPILDTTKFPGAAVGVAAAAPFIAQQCPACGWRRILEFVYAEINETKAKGETT